MATSAISPTGAAKQLAGIRQQAVRQQRISYRNTLNRPSRAVPTGPLAVAPRCSPWASTTGAISMTKRPLGTMTSRAEW